MTTGTAFLATLPDTATPEREQLIIDAVKNGENCVLNWYEVETSFEGHKGLIYVMADALQIGVPGNSVRVNVTAATAQHIADHLNCVLPTTRICDLVWEQASVKIAPQLQTPDAHMADTSRMEKHSRAVEDARAGRCGLLSNVGKHWVLTNKYSSRPKRAANYGWYSDGAPYLSASGHRMWQTLGLAHGVHHVDYSQVLRLVRGTMLVNGVTRPIQEVGSDPNYHGLVSSEDAIRFWRIPGTPATEEQPKPPAVVVPPRPTDRLSFARLLRRGVHGTDVMEWQRFIRVGADGKFGPHTERVTQSWQKAQGLLADGVVGPMTVAQANVVLARRELAGASPGDDLIDSFVQARNYHDIDRGDHVKHLVVHTMEASEKPTTAEAVAAWFAGDAAPQASAHFMIDNDSIVQGLREEVIGWHAPGANKSGIGLEHAGYARQTAKQWDDEFSRDMLERSARLAAYLCKKWHIPPVYVDEEGLNDGNPGVTTHWDVSKAFGKSNHWDPGKEFPMDDYLALVKKLMGE